jgi:hypothetical protein
MIIAGYDYSIVGGDISNSQMILMKVNAAGTSIIWQEKFGVAGKNNLIQNMIITADNNIVIVGTAGRDAVYNNNRAVMMKFKSLDGSLLWQNNLYDNALTIGGEVYYAVTQLGTAGNSQLVAVGAHDARPGTSDALISMVDQNSGTLIYSEVYNVDDNSSEALLGVCTSADGLSVYIAGDYNGADYQDGRVHMYTPGMYAVGPYVPGHFVWNDWFDFSLPGLSVNGNGVVTAGNLQLNDNFLSDIYLSGGKLLVLGGNLNDYTFTGGEGESVLRLNAVDGSGPELWQVQSSNDLYANTAKFTVVNSDHIINVQAPSNAWNDPIIWLSGSPASTVVTDITSLTAPPITTIPVKYTSPAPCLHSLMDMTIVGPNLYMAGATNDPYYGFGQNDIYIVNTPTNLPIDNLCDNADTTGKLAVPITSLTHTMNMYNFTPDFIDLTPVPTFYNIDTLCGKINPVHQPCSSSFDTINTNISATDTFSANGCAYICTANSVLGYGWTMAEYIWNLGGGPIIDYSTASTDNQYVTVPYLGTQVVTVTYVAVDLAGDTCNFTQTITLTCTPPPCYDTACSQIIIQGLNTVNGTGVLGTSSTSGTIGIATPNAAGGNPNDSCTFTACANICTANTIVGYDWSLDIGGSVTHHTSAHTDCWTFSVPSGTTAVVTVVVHIINFNYAPGTDPCCEAVLTQTVTCGQITQPCNCFLANGTGISDVFTGDDAAGANCLFNVTAMAGLNKGCKIQGYQWTINGVPQPFIGSPLTSNTILVPVPYGTSVTVSVTIIAVDQNGNKCTVTENVTLNCDQNGNGTDGNPLSRKANLSNGGTQQGGGIQVFPNPTNDGITVTASGININTLQVIDVNGKKVGNYTFDNAQSVNVSLGNLPPGTYMLRVNDTISKVVTRK